MKEVIQSIIAVGGFGYLNYQILAAIRDIDWGSEQDKKYLLICLSSLDYAIYWLLDIFFKNPVIIIPLTILIAVIISLFIIPYLVDFLYGVINWVRKKEKLGKLEQTSMYDVFASDTSCQNCFVFKLGDRNILSSGYISTTSGKGDDLSLILSPYISDNDPEKYALRSEDELIEYLDKEKIQAKIYLNLEKQIKFIYF